GSDQGAENFVDVHRLGGCCVVHVPIIRGADVRASLFLINRHTVSRLLDARTFPVLPPAPPVPPARRQPARGGTTPTSFPLPIGLLRRSRPDRPAPTRR